MKNENGSLIRQLGTGFCFLYLKGSALLDGTSLLNIAARKQTILGKMLFDNQRQALLPGASSLYSCFYASISQFATIHQNLEFLIQRVELWCCIIPFQISTFLNQPSHTLTFNSKTILNHQNKTKLIAHLPTPPSKTDEFDRVRNKTNTFFLAAI